MGNSIPGHIIGTTLSGISTDVLSGVGSTLSGHPNWHQFTHDWSTLGHAVAYGTGPDSTNSTIRGWYTPADVQEAGQTAAAAAGAQAARDSSQFNTWTATNHVVSSQYSGAMSNVTRPSQLAAISDPATKNAIASSSGQGKQALYQNFQAADQQAASNLGTPIATPAATS